MDERDEVCVLMKLIVGKEMRTARENKLGDQARGTWIYGEAWNVGRLAPRFLARTLGMVVSFAELRDRVKNLALGRWWVLFWT